MSATSAAVVLRERSVVGSAAEGVLLPQLRWWITTVR